MSYYVARPGADGKVRIDCVHSEETAAKIIQSPPPVDARGLEVQ
jgi:hypothetical protein